MSTEDLLKPRYKVIADYPGMPFYLGQIMILKQNNNDWVYEWAGYDGMYEMGALEFYEYPHLFKKLEWWEERRPEDMPEYVKIGDSVYKVVDYSDYKGGTFYTRSTNRISRASYPLKNSIPATKEEYEASTKAKQ